MVEIVAANGPPESIPSEVGLEDVEQFLAELLAQQPPELRKTEFFTVHSPVKEGEDSNVAMMAQMLDIKGTWNKFVTSDNLLDKFGLVQQVRVSRTPSRRESRARPTVPRKYRPCGGDGCSARAQWARRDTPRKGNTGGGAGRPRGERPA